MLNIVIFMLNKLYDNKNKEYYIELPFNYIDAYDIKNSYSKLKEFIFDDYNYEGCYSLIYNPDEKAEFNHDNLTITFGQITKYTCVGENGPVRAKTDIEDGLMHELVHAYRYDIMVYNYSRVPKSINIKGKEYSYYYEEMQTVGLWQTPNWGNNMIITENVLRVENNKLARLHY